MRNVTSRRKNHIHTNHSITVRKHAGTGSCPTLVRSFAAMAFAWHIRHLFLCDFKVVLIRKWALDVIRVVETVLRPIHANCRSVITATVCCTDIADIQRANPSGEGTPLLCSSAFPHRTRLKRADHKTTSLCIGPLTWCLFMRLNVQHS